MTKSTPRSLAIWPLTRQIVLNLSESALIASRTSPTDKAIELCEQASITLVGYLRGSSMEIYSHPQQLNLGAAADSARD